MKFTWPKSRTLKGVEKIMATLDEVKADLDNLVAAVDAMTTAFTDLVAQLQANANDPAKVQAIADEITAEIAKVQAATPK